MGSACCVAVKGRTVQGTPENECPNHSNQISPAWSFHWDNRGRTTNGTGTGTPPLSWFSDGINRLISVDVKSSSTNGDSGYPSESGSPLYTPSQKSRSFSDNTNPQIIPASCLRQSWWAQRGRRCRGRTPEGVGGEYFDVWPVSSQRGGRWSFSSDVFVERMMDCRVLPSPPSDDVQECGICGKMLAGVPQRKAAAHDEISVVAVLVCGHVFHAGCLENVTAESDMYDPWCPVCPCGSGKQSGKVCSKSAEMMMRRRFRTGKKSGNRVVDSDDSAVLFERKKERRPPPGGGSGSSDAASGSFGNPFLRRLSFGSRSDKPFLENQSSSSSSSRKKVFFWTRSGKE